MEKLITDGRIHPARIEETVDKARREVEATIKQAGERAVVDAGVNGVHPELVKLLGKLKYRTSYGQNVLNHSLEVSYIAGLMASEIGADIKTARRAGLCTISERRLTTSSTALMWSLAWNTPSGSAKTKPWFMQFRHIMVM